MECALCHRLDYTKLPSGRRRPYSPDHRSRKVDAMICGDCTAYLIQGKRSHIPWDGKLEKEAILAPEDQSLRRRKGA